MNPLAGWGFTDAAAFNRHVLALKSADADTAIPRTQARWITPERVQEYADTLNEPPQPWQIMQHFSCCYASALKHRRKLIDLIARRASVRPHLKVRHSGDAQAMKADGQNG